MTYQAGTQSSSSVPIKVDLSFDGVAVNWGGDNLYSMAPISNRSESIDGSYEISDLDVELIDTNGSIWGSLGNGTSAFYKTMVATVYVGGRWNTTSYGPSGNQRLAVQDRVGAGTYVVHTGQIVEVSKRNRLVRIKSQNNLRAFEDIEWRFPYFMYQSTPTKVIGSYYFFNNDIAGAYVHSPSDWDEARENYTIYAACGTELILDAFSLARYQSIADRGTMGLKNGYWYPGTQFYEDFPVVKFLGTYLGTYLGTISSDDDARKYGYASCDDAEAAKSGTRYVLNMTRLSVRDGTLPSGSQLFYQQNLVLSNTPANLFREMVAGHCVTPYFGTDNIEQSSFGTSQGYTAFQAFSQRIDPRGGKVMPYIKDLMSSTYGNFSVNVNNKFVYRAYGPRNLTASIGTINGTTLIESAFTNARSEAKNRVVLRYAYSSEGNDYSKTIELKGSGWNGTVDNPLNLQSKWIQNDNEAKALAQRILNRFANTAPKIELTVSLLHSGLELGTLMSVSDPDSGFSGKIVEIIGYDKDFTESRKVTLNCVDGESIYSRKGFGQWASGPTLPSGPVTGTSTFGWGTSGTMANIDVSTYGSMFVWF